MHDGGELGCGDYFCSSHLVYPDWPPNRQNEGEVRQLCGPCDDRFERLVGIPVSVDGVMHRATFTVGRDIESLQAKCGAPMSEVEDWRSTDERCLNCWEQERIIDDLDAFKAAAGAAW